ncbi:hypothetical protein V6Z12_D11G225800 [Gossypium hirsutum]
MSGRETSIMSSPRHSRSSCPINFRQIKFSSPSSRPKSFLSSPTTEVAKKITPTASSMLRFPFNNEMIFPMSFLNSVNSGSETLSSSSRSSCSLISASSIFAKIRGHDGKWSLM